MRAWNDISGGEKIRTSYCKYLDDLKENNLLKEKDVCM